jgi:nucleoside phosphorylase
MLDEEYTASDLPKHPRDTNSYILGRIDVHKIALTCLPIVGNNSAGLVAHHMRNTFVNLKFGLMVGIEGGVPSEEPEIRLDDVVVSKPSGTHSGVIQYDSGKFIQNEEFMVTEALPPPDKELLNATNRLQAKHDMVDNRITQNIQEMLLKNPKMAQTGYKCPGKEYDRLFRTDYVHRGNDDTCAACDETQVVPRPHRADDRPVTYYGNIASENAVMRDAVKRDQLGKQHDALCFEMEAAGLMSEFPCLIIRGICDYSDSHKNKDWQGYAAATAAAYAKELLGVVYAGGMFSDYNLSADSVHSSSEPKCVLDRETISCQPVYLTARTFPLIA